MSENPATGLTGLSATSSSTVTIHQASIRSVPPWQGREWRLPLQLRLVELSTARSS